MDLGIVQVCRPLVCDNGQLVAYGLPMVFSVAILAIDHYTGTKLSHEFLFFLIHFVLSFSVQVRFHQTLILFVVMQRMHILEALEAFSDMGVTGNFHQAQNAFNE